MHHITQPEEILTSLSERQLYFYGSAEDVGVDARPTSTRMMVNQFLRFLFTSKKTIAVPSARLPAMVRFCKFYPERLTWIPGPMSVFI